MLFEIFTFFIGNGNRKIINKLIEKKGALLWKFEFMISNA